MKNQLLIIVLTLSGFGLFAQTQNINVEKSTINWTGKKIGGKHQGFIKITEGSLELKKDKIASGQFIINMTSITNTDLENETYNQKLVGHLKSDDFFGVEAFPTAIFKVTKSTKFADDKATLTGEVTIKGMTETISFEVTKTENSYTGKMEIDRSKFNVKYGSSSFFDSLGDKAIDDIFTLEIELFID